ncbi:MAG: S8 family peptidase, partial [Chthoniobacteraceae bacterium]
MPGEQPTVLRHLDYSGRAKPQPYIAKGGGGGAFKLFPRQRAAHAGKLRGELQQVQLEAERLRLSQELANYEEDAGVTLEIRGVPNHPLKLEPLDSPRLGITLENVRQESVVLSGGEEAVVVVAKVFVKHGKLTYLTKRVEDYAREATRTAKTGKVIHTDHEDFIANIESIGIAAIEAFWTSKHPLPGMDVAAWWEVWVRVGSEAERARHEAAVEREAERLGMRRKEGKLVLPEHAVYLIKTTRRALASATALLNFVSELRHPALTAGFFIEQTPAEQQQWAAELKSRLVPPPDNAPAVCVLDTGVNRGHPLLSDLLAESDHDTVRAEWGKDDHYTNGHGTQMAGLAAYGDLTPLLDSDGQVALSHRLESVKILPRYGHNEPEHYGSIAQEAMSQAEINAPERQRVFALAVTATDAPDFTENGKPSAWSAALDSHTSGAMEDEDTKRLVCVSGGNVWVRNRNEYPSRNEKTSIEDPAQSWNALTVGACTAKDIVTDHNGNIVPDAVCIATRGGLSPHSATSCPWKSPESRHWPLKPDVVFEGGNVAADAAGNREDRDSLSLLSTNSDIQRRLFAPFCATSAATALAARMAAQIQAEYPAFLPETVRALLVHSAEWTGEMQRGADLRNKSHVAHILRRFGHGVPELTRALASARSRATLICQDSLQPFVKEKDGVKTRDMMLYRLPWPKDLLQSHGNAAVRLRATLSYFIEPNPGSRVVTSKYRYAGCNLRFLVQTATEKSLNNFIARVSDAVSDDDRNAYTKPDDTTTGWLLGEDLRCRGSIHSDTWRGTAAQLALM